MQKFSFNFHALNMDRNKALDWIKANKPNVALVLNDESFASQVADLGVPNVILRVTTNDDSIHSKISSFREWWNLVKAKYNDKRLIVHFCNEPKGNLKRLNDMCVEGMGILYAEGRRGIFGNFAVGNPEIKDWQTDLSGMLAEIVKYGGWFFLGLHEYFMYDPALCSPYEIGRYKVLSNKIPIIFTEFGSDFIQDIYDHTDIKQNLHGFKSHLGYYASKGLDAEAVYLKFIKNIFDAFYNPDSNVHGACYFSFGDSGGWDDYNAQDAGFINKVGVLKMSDVGATNEPVSIKSIYPEGTNRRVAPTNGAIKGQVTTPVTVTKLQVEGAWTKYRFTDGDFWVYSTYVTESPISASSTVTVELANAPQEVVDRVKALIQELTEIFKKYDAETR